MSLNTNRGRLIVFEGLDGTGKTTLSLAVARALGAHWTTTPGTGMRNVRSQVDAELDGLPIAQQLFYAATVLAESRRIEAIRDAGTDVVVDRYWLTTWAYARARQAQVSLREVEAYVPAATATVLVELAEPERLRRMALRGASALDRWTADPTIARAILRNFRMGLSKRVAGRGLRLIVDGLAPEDAVSAALDLLHQDDRVCALAA